MRFSAHGNIIYRCENASVFTKSRTWKAGLRTKTTTASNAVNAPLINLVTFTLSWLHLKIYFELFSFPVYHRIC